MRTSVQRRRIATINLHWRTYGFGCACSVQPVERSKEAFSDGKPRSVPMHHAMRPLLHRLIERAGHNGFPFENPKTGKPIRDVKAAWRHALRDAKI